jgi:N-formylglutamate amidohydrolase
MSKSLPLLISVPHAGIWIPPEVRDLCILTEKQILKDSDEGAAEIYAIEENAVHYVTTHVARAIIDLNRPPDDRRRDGVVKTHTCWMEAVYSTFPGEETVNTLLEKYYYPYHRQLTALAGSNVILGIDCHTMSETGPPEGPDPDKTRPWVCLSNADGTCPRDWFDRMGKFFAEQFNGNVSLNDPFKGGYITRSHASEMPWIQLELSRATYMSHTEKRERVLTAMTQWVKDVS